MEDKDIKKIAEIFVNYSCKIKKGDVVLISADLEAKPLVKEIYRQSLLRGAYPRIEWGIDDFSKIYYDNVNKDQLLYYPKISEFAFKNTDVFIYIRSPLNRDELKNCDTRKMTLRQKILRPLLEIRLKKRWLVFIWPNKTYAKDAGLSLNKFKKFVFEATLLDWKKISKRMNKIASYLNKSDKIIIEGKETKISFSIKGKKAVVANGAYNMPDGEIFTAINEKTANGYIYFDYPLRVFGKKIKNIKLWFKNGKVIKFNSSDNNSLKKMLNTDKGSKYIGEFAFGFNPKINRFSDALLFDEKINNSIHFALGNAYPECNGKNKSAIHEDIVKDMKKGKVFADGKLIYKDGKFLI